MASPSIAGEVTRLLQALHGGDRSALDRLLPHVYDELRGMARARLRGRPGSSMQPTVLVHEAYLKLARAGTVNAADRSHFLAIAATAMRQVVVDHARAALSQKRGGGWQQTTLEAEPAAVQLAPEDVIALDRALDRLDPRQRTVVECRYFAGMEEEEIAEALGVSSRTVRREWVKARAWLYTELYPDATP
jgi:RNA polymerase sigma-70 factor, ECF subfamily